VTYYVTLVRDSPLLTNQEELMSQHQTQLKLAYVNCKIVSTNKNGNIARTSLSSNASSAALSASSLLTKSATLQRLRPKLAAVIEGLIDDMLDELEGRRP